MATPSYTDILEKDILELLHLQNIPAEKKQAIYLQLYRTIENRTILRLDNLLSNAETDEWKKLLEEGDRAGAEGYLKERGIDVQKMMLEETAVLKAQLVFMLDDSAKKPAAGHLGGARPASTALDVEDEIPYPVKFGAGVTPASSEVKTGPATAKVA